MAEVTQLFNLEHKNPKRLLNRRTYTTHTHSQGLGNALINITLTTTGCLATSLPSLTQQHPLPVSAHVGVHGDLTWAELGEGNGGS